LVYFYKNDFSSSVFVILPNLLRRTS